MIRINLIRQIYRHKYSTAHPEAGKIMRNILSSSMQYFYTVLQTIIMDIIQNTIMLLWFFHN
ncbi:hypothetical protein ATY38_06190 [Nitrosomonas ureae]|nr:hypothetical protein ATY38_06190 [Nitrosomonas ureae]